MMRHGFSITSTGALCRIGVDRRRRQRSVGRAGCATRADSAGPAAVGRWRARALPITNETPLSTSARPYLLPVMQRPVHAPDQTAPSIQAATAWVLLREKLSRPRS